MAYNPYYQNSYFQQQPNFYGNGAMPDMLSQQKMQYQQPMQTQPIPNPTPSNDMIWVLGEVEAQSYPVAPNNTVTLWDKNQKTFYVKTANAQGIPSIQTYDFSERTQTASQMPENHVCKCGDNFINKTELEQINGKFDDIFNRLQILEEKPKAKTTKSSKGDEE